MDDLSRLRSEYVDRVRRFAGSDSYSYFNRSNLFFLQVRQRALLNLLKSQGITELSSLRILEVGCGAGSVLIEYLGYGVSPKNLFGIDLLHDRLIQAHQRLSGSCFSNSDGQYLPFPPKSFDLVLQYTAITSILDSNIRRNMCTDMLRVLRSPDPTSGKPGGMILSYDFWLNPTNKQTRGLRMAEIRTSFPDCQIEYKRITLAPPLARRLVPISWLFSSLLEKLSIFNTHYLVAISPLNN